MNFLSVLKLELTLVILLTIIIQLKSCANEVISVLLGVNQSLLFSLTMISLRPGRLSCLLVLCSTSPS